MDKTAKLEYQKKLEQYLEDKNIYNMFEDLMQLLVIHKPEDPLNFLIERLSRPESIFFHCLSLNVYFCVQSQKNLPGWPRRVKFKGNSAGVVWLFRLYSGLNRGSFEEGNQQKIKFRTRNRTFSEDVHLCEGWGGDWDCEEGNQSTGEREEELHHWGVPENESAGVGHAKCRYHPECVHNFEFVQRENVRRMLVTRCFWELNFEFL